MNTHARWGFLRPWCNVLQYRIHYCGLEGDVDDVGDAWNSQQRALQVILPTRTGIYGEYKDEATFQMEFQSTREALALMAAVAHVDLDGWKFLLTNHCGVDFGAEQEEDDEVQVRFVLLMEHHAETDLVQLCGVVQRRCLSPGYFSTLHKIAAMDGSWRPDRPGVDVEIPIRVIFSSSTMLKTKAAPIPILLSIQNAERLIREEWEGYNWSLENQPVESGQLRCTFTLEPMIGDLRGLGCAPEIAETMAKFVGGNVWFSQISIKADMDRQRDNRATPMSFRQMMAVIFDATRRSQELANTRYCSKATTYNQQEIPLQMGTVSMKCDYTLGPSEYEAMFSAIALTQTTRNLTIRLQLNANDPINHKHWWKWLAYGCLSERARKCSALKSLELTDIDDMNIQDMAEFSAVLSSEHPEEVLYCLPRGRVDERDALLKKGALVHWLLSKQGELQYNSLPVKFSAAVPYVRTFSDDGKSERVNVLIPGFGRCLVQRADLMIHQSQTGDPKERGLASLTLRFSSCAQPTSRAGLHHLLTASGSSLRCLIIDGPGEELDANRILQNCPHLVELSLRNGWVGIGLNFTEFHARKQAIPKLYIRWNDIDGLTRNLCDKHNSFTKSLRRLSICLINLEGFGHKRWVHQDPAINVYLEALLEMLKVNQILEHVEVIVPSEYQNYGDYFRAHHRKPTNRSKKLSTGIKTAFISVLSANISFSSVKMDKEMKHERSASRLTSFDLDHRDLLTIFEFATSPVVRQVYFRKK